MLYKQLSLQEFESYHSDIIRCFQCIEWDLKLIYAGMKSGDFDDNLDLLDNANLGKTIKKLKQIDYSDGNPDLSESDYKLLDEIREIRNYWCHQCFLDYVYIQDDYERNSEFQKIGRRLVNEYNRVKRLSENIEALRLRKLKEYNRI